MALIKVLLCGMIISFLGTLPLSTLNIAAMQISVQESIRSAIYFSIGTLVAEMILVRVSLIGINWVRRQKILFRWFEWVTFFIIAAFAVGSFIAATKNHEARNVLLNNNMNRLALGMVMSILTPTHIPFWFGWSTVLFNKKILKATPTFYNIYIIGIGIGTFIGNAVFIFGGKLIVNKLNANQNILNWAIGAIFGITAIIQLMKILLHKDAAEKLEPKEGL